MSKTQKFIALAILINVAFYLPGLISPQLPDFLVVVISFGTLFAFFYVYFNYIIKVIYKFAGIDIKSNKKPNHNEASLVAKYWQIWITTTVLTYIAYTLLFERENLVASLVIGSVGIGLMMLAYINSKNKIMGHSKENLFQ